MNLQHMGENSAGNHEYITQSGVCRDGFICFKDEFVDICYATHPVYCWPEHRHDRHQFLLMLDDCATAELSWRATAGMPHTQLLSGKHLCFVEKNVTHSFRWNVPSALACLYVSETLMVEIAPNAGWNGVLIYRWGELMHRDLLALALAKLMAELCRRHNDLHPLHLRVAGILLGAQLLKIHLRMETHDLKSSKLNDDQLARVLNWINEHLAEKIVVRELARIAGASKDHFGRKFKASTGYTPHHYVLIERVHRALELLEKGGMRMSEIAAASGFSDQSHLSRSLREFYGQMLSGEKEEE